MSLGSKIGEKIAGWLTKNPDLQKFGERVESSLSDWLARQPGTEGLLMKLSCTACGNRWGEKLDLKKMKLAEAVQKCMKCPICGSQKLKVVRD